LKAQHAEHHTNLGSGASTGFGECVLVCRLKLLSSLAYGVLAICPTGNLAEIDSKNSCQHQHTVTDSTLQIKQLNTAWQAF